MPKQNDLFVQAEFDFSNLTGVAVHQPAEEKEVRPAGADEMDKGTAASNDPTHLSHPLATVVDRLSQADQTGTLFPESALGTSPEHREQGRGNEQTTGRFRNDKQLSEEQVARRKHFDIHQYARRKLFVLPDQGAPLRELFPTGRERSEQVMGYMQRREILFNKTGGLRKLKPDQQREAMEKLRPLFYHYPYQVLNLLARRVAQGALARPWRGKTVTFRKATEFIESWMAEDGFEHTHPEVRSWIATQKKLSPQLAPKRSQVQLFQNLQARAGVLEEALARVQRRQQAQFPLEDESL